jgi:pimeloyl-ACP methyl ester carboxylesterase
VAGFAGDPPRANASGAFFEPVLADIDAYAATLRRRPIVMGHSLGGTLGLALAERHPEHLSKLLIVDALPFFGVVMGGPTATVETVRPMAEGMRARMSGRMPEAMARGMMAQMVTAPADVDRVTAWSMASEPSVVASAMTDDMLADLRPGLASIRTPVTVLYESALEALIQAGYATLGPKTLIVVPGARHFIMYDQPARFEAEVDAFLRR